MPPAPRRRTRAALAVALLLVVAFAVGLRRALDSSLTPGERELVGRWRFQVDGWSGDHFCEYELRANGTWACRISDPKLDRVIKWNPAGAFWRRPGNALVICEPNRLAPPWWDVFRTRRPEVQAYDLTSDGLNRYRYVAGGSRQRPAGPGTVGTMARLPDAD